MTRNNVLTSIPVQLSAGRFELGAPVPIVQIGAGLPGPYQYDVSADGQRILALMPVDSAAPSLTVLVDWTALVHRIGR